MTDHVRLAERLTRALGLKLPPIAVVLSDSAPDGVPAFQGQVAAGCKFWELAASGPFHTVARDHALCAIGVYTHNLAGAPADYPAELKTVLGVLDEMEYARPDDVARVPVLERSPRYVTYAPLDQTPMPPDVVLLFAHARQGLVITEATQQVEPDAPPALGRPACAVIPQAINSGGAALSLGCCGARAYLNELGDDTALWALPGARLEAYVDRLEKLAYANQRLSRFHQLRKADVEAGQHPSYAQSMQRLQG
ncbi:MAG: DUF169 domain-containing protein [Gammaproteobacteria bacterium]|nr:DUF169 domain-containing protein [Gammaproteobacteria bacterium]